MSWILIFTSLVVTSLCATCNEPKPLIETPRRNASAGEGGGSPSQRERERGLQYAANRGRAAMATGKRRPHASGQREEDGVRGEGAEGHNPGKYQLATLMRNLIVRQC